MGEAVPGFLMDRHDDGLCHAYVSKSIGRLEHIASHLLIRSRTREACNWQTMSRLLKPMEPLVGFEPTTCSLRMSCSTPELQRRWVVTEQTKVGQYPQAGNRAMVGARSNCDFVPTKNARIFQGFGAMPCALGGAAGALGSGAGGGENITFSQFGFLSGPDPRNWNIP